MTKKEVNGIFVLEINGKNIRTKKWKKPETKKKLKR